VTSRRGDLTIDVIDESMTLQKVGDGRRVHCLDGRQGRLIDGR
jgi:hypothetical protein